jgi:MFS family permease
MKLDWRKTFLIGFGFLGISIIWQLYNLFVPIFLQAGSPAFDAQNGLETYTVAAGDTWAAIAEQHAVSLDDLLRINNAQPDTPLEADQKVTIVPYRGFGLGAGAAGFIMTLDNIAALFILPLIGVWSDRTRTRIGRRYPYILAAAPVAAVAFALIPVAGGLIDPSANGSIEQNGGAFAFFMIAAGIMLVAMAVLRTPVIALMPDIIPSLLRSKANGVINLMGGVGGIIAALGLARLFDVNPIWPFLIGAVVMIVAIIMLFVSVREPKVSELAHPESDEEELFQGLKGARAIPPEYRRSLTFLLLAIFCWFVGYNAIETFFSSYAVTTLGVSAGTAGTLFSVALAAFILFAVPAGYLGTRFGRRRTITAGLILFGVLLVVAAFVPNTTVITIILAGGGAGWALVNINSLPMVVDITDDERLLGTYTGLYYFASMSAAIAGPVLNGIIIELSGSNYNMIFFVTPFFFALAAGCMMLVTRGEAHASHPQTQAA